MTNPTDLTQSDVLNFATMGVRPLPEPVRVFRVQRLNPAESSRTIWQTLGWFWIQAGRVEWESCSSAREEQDRATKGELADALRMIVDVKPHAAGLERRDLRLRVDLDDSRLDLEWPSVRFCGATDDDGRCHELAVASCDSCERRLCEGHVRETTAYGMDWAGCGSDIVGGCQK